MRYRKQPVIGEQYTLEKLLKMPDSGVVGTEVSAKTIDGTPVQNTKVLSVLVLSFLPVASIKEASPQLNGRVVGGAVTGYSVHRLHHNRTKVLDGE
jgi:hypothetical protein